MHKMMRQNPHKHGASVNPMHFLGAYLKQNLLIT